MSLKNTISERYHIVATGDYRGEHEAPDRDGSAPMHKLDGTYPDDIYSVEGARMYGDSGGDSRDVQSVSVIIGVKGRPNAGVKVYRAVPNILSRDGQISALQEQKRYILKHGKVPKGVVTSLNSSRYYEKLSDDIAALEAQPSTPDAEKIKLNKGDWVTINRAYAVEHGESNLNNRYKILTKTVKASQLFTDGNSIHEWGFDP